MASKSIKGFGARYGRKIRNKLKTILDQRQAKHVCPRCRSTRIKRIAAGIWACKKCEVKFTGRAYEVGKRAFKEAER